jgi:RING finger and SPRY domain-containing protein 1
VNIVVLGCLIDFDRREVIFSINGQTIDPLHQLFSSSSSSSNLSNESYFAAASFMSYQHCRFNFGSEAFRYPPDTYQTFNQHGHLPDEKRCILPKYKKRELLRSLANDESDCFLCVDSPATTQLLPCQHQGICQACASKLQACPICRSAIHDRTIIHS